MTEQQQANYENNELIQRIRKEYGTERTIIKGASEITGALQNELRFSESKSRESGGDSTEGNRGTTSGENGISRVEPALERDNSREGRTGTTAYESNGGANTDSGPAYSPLPVSIKEKIAVLYDQDPHITPRAAAAELACSNETAARYLRELRRHGPGGGAGQLTQDQAAKPSGLNALPHPNEQRARGAGQLTQDQAAGNKRGILGLLSGKKREKASGSGRDKPLTANEAESLRKPLTAALLDYFKYADEIIYATNKRHIHITIWSSIDEEDAAVLVDIWLARAKRSAAAAQHVAFMVEKHQELRVGIILIPRFYETFRAYVDGGGIGIR